MSISEAFHQLFQILKSPETLPVAGKFWIVKVIGSLCAWIGLPLPDWALELISMLISMGAIIGSFMGLFALTSVLERKILARMQNRYGPNRVGPLGLFQPVADGIKMLTKEDIVPRNADKTAHFFAPVVMVVSSLLVCAIIPFGRGMAAVDLQTGILYYFAVTAGTEVAVFMAGWASNNKYSVLGAMRAIAQMISYVLPMVLCALVVAMISGSLSLVKITEAQGGYTLSIFPHWYVLTPWGFAGCVLFYISALAESNRSPFDLSEGESELVAGHLTEYSGFKYATFFMAEYVGMFAINSLLVTLFLGGWQAPMEFLTFIPTWCWFLIKMLALIFSMIWVRATLPRFRVDHLMQFAWKFMLPMSFATLVAAAVWHFAGRGTGAWLIAAAIIFVPYLALGNLFTRSYSLERRQYLFSE